MRWSATGISDDFIGNVDPLFVKNVRLLVVTAELVTGSNCCAIVDSQSRSWGSRIYNVTVLRLLVAAKVFLDKRVMRYYYGQG